MKTTRPTDPVAGKIGGVEVSIAAAGALTIEGDEVASEVAGASVTEEVVVALTTEEGAAVEAGSTVAGAAVTEEAVGGVDAAGTEEVVAVTEAVAAVTEAVAETGTPGEETEEGSIREGSKTEKVSKGETTHKIKRSSLIKGDKIVHF